MAEARKDMLASGGPDHAQLKKDYDGVLQELENFSAKNKSLLNPNTLEQTQSVVSVFDPTPASDLYTSGQALIRGDYVGALADWLSALGSLSPYTRPVRPFAKGIKKIPKAYHVWKAGRELTRLTAKLKKTKAKLCDAQRRVADIVREKRKTKGAKSKCNIWGTRLPQTGTWSKPGLEGRGNSLWTSRDGTYTIQYNKGYPDFQTARINGQKVTWNPKPGDPAFATFDAKVEIVDMRKSSADSLEANEAMRIRLNDPGWKQPPNYTWHHGEDGVSMTLVRKDAHHAMKGKKNIFPPHLGGDSLSTDF